jgi:hypothetical protein
MEGESERWRLATTTRGELSQVKRIPHSFCRAIERSWLHGSLARNSSWPPRPDPGKKLRSLLLQDAMPRSDLTMKLRMGIITAFGRQCRINAGIMQWTGISTGAFAYFETEKSETETKIRKIRISVSKKGRIQGASPQPVTRRPEDTWN